MALVYNKVYAPNFLFNLSYLPSLPSDNRTQKIFSGKKQKRNKSDTNTGASNSSAKVITDMTTDAAINIIISSTQTLVFSIDPNILLRINSCLLIGKVEVKKQKRKIKRYILAPALLSIIKWSHRISLLVWRLSLIKIV